MRVKFVNEAQPPASKNTDEDAQSSETAVKENEPNCNSKDGDTSDRSSSPKLTVNAFAVAATIHYTMDWEPPKIQADTDLPTKHFQRKRAISDSDPNFDVIEAASEPKRSRPTSPEESLKPSTSSGLVTICDDSSSEPGINNSNDSNSESEIVVELDVQHYLLDADGDEFNLYDIQDFDENVVETQTTEKFTQPPSSTDTNDGIETLKTAMKECELDFNSKDENKSNSTKARDRPSSPELPAITLTVKAVVHHAMDWEPPKLEPDTDLPTKCSHRKQAIADSHINFNLIETVPEPKPPKLPKPPTPPLDLSVFFYDSPDELGDLFIICDDSPSQPNTNNDDERSDPALPVDLSRPFILPDSGTFCNDSPYEPDKNNDDEPVVVEPDILSFFLQNDDDEVNFYDEPDLDTDRD